MRHLMRTALALVIGICVADARAEVPGKPTLDEVKAALASFGDGIRGAKAKMAGVSFAVPFWYLGYEYKSGYRAADATCKEAWGAQGTVTEAAKMDDFVVCLGRAASDHVGPDLPASDHSSHFKVTWAEAKLGNLPAQFKGQRSKLAKLARDHLIVLSRYSPEGDGESLNLYVAHRDSGGVVLDAWLCAVGEPTSRRVQHP